MSQDFINQLDALISQADGAEEVKETPEETQETPEEIVSEGDALKLVEARQDGQECQEMAVEEVVDPEPYPDPEPDEFGPVKETSAEKARRLELNKPLVGTVGLTKMAHGSMILNDICTQCVRCKLKLTDAVSVERGMGPECSSKGYAEDPKDPDEMGAMIELSEYPALVDFITEHYKPHGVRGLMNGLVRVAALNRKSPVHAACANAIELLGYNKLAATLRDSLAIMSIKPSESHPNHLCVNVRRRDYTREWTQDCYRSIPHVFYDRSERGLIVANRVETKGALWLAMIRHYAGECAKTPQGTVRIPYMDEYLAEKAKKKLTRVA